jgi:hypothetical protein
VDLGDYTVLNAGDPSLVIRPLPFSDLDYFTDEYPVAVSRVNSYMSSLAQKRRLTYHNKECDGNRCLQERLLLELSLGEKLR